MPALMLIGLNSQTILTTCEEHAQLREGVFPRLGGHFSVPPPPLGAALAALEQALATVSQSKCFFVPALRGLISSPRTSVAAVTTEYVSSSL